MKLVSLVLRHWRSFDRLELEFPDGVIGVRGANGAGKTTIAEAIGWALFGKLRPGQKIGDLHRQDAPQGARAHAELEFRLGDTLYRVERTAGGAAKLYIGDGPDPETTQTRATNARLIQELDLTWETFQRTVYARQKDVAALDPSATSEQRKRHVERLLGLERYRLAAEKARAAAKELEAELRGLREQAPDATALQSELDAAAAAASGNDPEVQAAQERLTAADAAIERLEAAIEDERGRAGRDEALTGERERLTQALADDQRSLDAKRKRLQAYDAQVTRLAELDGQPADLSVLETARRDWDALERCGDELRRALEALEADAFDADAAAARSESLDVLRGELEDLQAAPVPEVAPHEARVAALVAADGLPPAQAARAALAQVAEQRDDARTRRTVVQQQRVRDEAHLAEIEASGESAECPICLRAYGPDLPGIVARHRETLERLRGEETGLAAACARLETAHADAGALVQRAEAAERGLAETTGPDDLGTARAALERARAAATARAARLAQLRADVPALAEQVRADRAAAREHDGRQAVVTDRRERVRAAAARLGVHMYEATLHAVAVSAFEAAEQADRERATLRAAVEAARDLPAEVETLTTRIAEAEARRETVAGELRALAFDAGRLPALRDELVRARTDHRECGEALLAAKVLATQRDDTVRDLTRRLAEARAAHELIAARERTLREHQVAGTLLSDFRSHQNLRAWPRLEEGASARLSEATDGRYADVRLSEDYRLMIVDRGEAFGLDRFSGGEQDLANLCLRLAIADWVARERHVEVGFVILDEVFGSQDEDRRHRLMTELRSLGNRFHQLLVITHVPEIAELCEHQLEVTLTAPGTSTAVFR